MVLRAIVCLWFYAVLLVLLFSTTERLLTIFSASRFVVVVFQIEESSMASKKAAMRQEAMRQKAKQKAGTAKKMPSESSEQRKIKDSLLGAFWPRARFVCSLPCASRGC